MTSRSKYFINKNYETNPSVNGILEVKYDSQGNAIADRDILLESKYKPYDKPEVIGVRASRWYNVPYDSDADTDNVGDTLMISPSEIQTYYTEITRCKAKKVLNIKVWPDDKQGVYPL